MKVLLRRIAGTLSVAAALVCGLPAQASVFTQMVVFGDSLSDTGNVYAVTGGTVPAAPYFNGRFSNGPVWVETLASGLGLSANAVAVYAGGNNYAFGGARTGSGAAPVPGLLAQIGGLWAPAHPVADPDALYVVVGGGNDMRDARGPASTAASRQADAAAAYANLLNGVGYLAAAGARHILISNLADLGATPEAALLGLQANSTDVTLRFNTLVATIEATMEALFAGLDVDMVDMFGLSAAIRNDALGNGGGKYGITNVVAPCGTFAFSLGDSCDVSLYSDALHPSAYAHALLGNAALFTVVPAPGTAWLLLVAISGLLLTRRRGTITA